LDCYKGYLAGRYKGKHIVIYLKIKGAGYMNKKANTAVLSDKDKKIISQNKDICTESHGNGCIIKPENKINDKLN
jgi:hypothetical protein